MIVLEPKPLTRENFAPYGEVIDSQLSPTRKINDGQTELYHDLCTIDCAQQGGHVALNVYITKKMTLPFEVKVMERHPLASQAFLPLGQVSRMLVLVARGEHPPRAEDLELFISDGTQGINYAANTWHHPHLVLDHDATYTVIDRAKPAEEAVEANFELVTIAGEAIIKL